MNIMDQLLVDLLSSPSKIVDQLSIDSAGSLDQSHVQDCLYVARLSDHELSLRKFLCYDDEEALKIIFDEEDRRDLLRA